MVIRCMILDFGVGLKYTYTNINKISIMVIYNHEIFFKKLKLVDSNLKIMTEKEVLKAYRKAFGENLKRIRKEKISTLSGVDANTKFDASNYHKYELGNGNPTLETILIIANGLGVSPKDLLDFEFDYGEVGE